MCLFYPEEGVQGSVLHEFSDDHHRAAFGHNPFQVDDVWMVKLAHDGRLTQEVPPLTFSVAHLQRLNGYQDLSLPRLPEISTTHLPEFSCQYKVNVIVKKQSLSITCRNANIVVIVTAFVFRPKLKSK